MNLQFNFHSKLSIKANQLSLQIVAMDCELSLSLRSKVIASPMPRRHHNTCSAMQAEAGAEKRGVLRIERAREDKLNSIGSSMITTHMARTRTDLIRFSTRCQIKSLQMK